MSKRAMGLGLRGDSARLACTMSGSSARHHGTDEAEGKEEVSGKRKEEGRRKTGSRGQM